MRENQRERDRAAECRERQEPVFWHDGEVTTAGLQGSLQFVEGGWQGVQHPAEFGGQGLPKLVGAPCIEMLNARTCASRWRRC